MRIFTLRPCIYALALATLGFLALGTASCSETARTAPLHTVRILHAYPHDPEAFTQGLFLHDGKLYESTGQYGHSTIRIANPETGQVVRTQELSSEHFGEGVARLGNAAIQLTWKAGVGLIYDLNTLKPLKEFRYLGEGWGLCSVPQGLVMSDGSSELTFLSSHALAPVSAITVRDGDQEVSSLNELEWYKGLLLANLWLADDIAAIDPETGRVLGWIDLSSLREHLRQGAGAANGIAYDQENSRLLVTGKNWDKVFEVEVQPPLPTP